MENESQELTQYSSQTTSLVLEKESMDSMLRVAEMMASAKIQVPDHFRGNQADCLAVVMQSMQWGMNPFTVAQKTFLTGGKLGYEAQLVNAVAMSSGAFKEEPEFEFVGNWDKILGRVVEKQGKSGGKYYVAGWEAKDEAGLGVICTAKMGRNAKPRSVRLMLSQCGPRFSTQWATDPQQQITYAVIKKMVRRYAPAAILGVYTADELLEDEPERDVTPRTNERPTTPESLPEYPDEKFKKSIGSWGALIQSGKYTADDIITKVSSAYVLSESQIKEIRDFTRQEEPPEDVDDGTVNDEFMDELGDVEQ